MASFKIKCSRCKVNYVVTTARNQYGVACFECNKKDMAQEITDPAMKKMFDIPEEFYKESNFLRSIKINYLKYGNLSEKQVEFFKKVVDDMKKKSEAGKEETPKKQPVQEILTPVKKTQKLAKSTKKKAKTTE